VTLALLAVVSLPVLERTLLDRGKTCIVVGFELLLDIADAAVNFVDVLLGRCTEIFT
jgi:hypothetical protein